MTTMKPNTRLKDSLKKKEMARLTQRASSAQSLTTLITSIPKLDPAAVLPAVGALMDAADQYKASHPLVDPKGRRSKPSIADARASLLALHQVLCTAECLFDDLQVNVITALTAVNGSTLAELKPDFSKLLLTIETARYLVLSEPDKTPDFHRRVLAYQVANVFTHILKKTPSATRAKQLKENKSRGGAAYDRVLRATFKAAGVTDYDSGPLITAGLRLLKDPALPQQA